MSEVNGTPVVETPVSTVAFAVVQTGFITPEGEVMTFRDDQKRSFPQPIVVLPNKAKADRMKTRLEARSNKMESIEGLNTFTSTPIYGVRSIKIKAKVRTRVMTEEQKKAFVERTQGARKRKKGG